MRLSWIRRTPFKNSIGFFDFYKGILIVLIPIYHILQTWRGIYIEESYLLPQRPMLYKMTAIMMPTFFVISGLGFRPSSMKKCIRKQAGLFLLPYLYMALTSVFLVCLKNIIQGRPPLFDVLSYIYGFLLVHMGKSSILNIKIREASTGWFLWTLFWGWILLNLICKVKNEGIRNIIIALTGIFGIALTKWPIGIFCIPECLQVCIMLYTGYMIKTKKWFYDVIPFRQKIVLGVFSLIFLSFGGANMGESYWKLGILDFFGSMAGTLLLLKAYTFLVLPDNKAVECIMTVGRYSLWVMCLHGIDMLAINWENVIVHMRFPIWISIGTHLFLDALFIGGGCVVLYKLQKVRYRRRVK